MLRPEINTVQQHFGSTTAMQENKSSEATMIHKKKKKKKPWSERLPVERTMLSIVHQTSKCSQFSWSASRSGSVMVFVTQTGGLESTWENHESGVESSCGFGCASGCCSLHAP